jgi:hypothetical protein
LPLGPLQAQGIGRQAQGDALHSSPATALAAGQWPPEAQPLAAALKAQSHATSGQIGIEQLQLAI